MNPVGSMLLPPVCLETRCPSSLFRELSLNVNPDTQAREFELYNIMLFGVED